MNDSYNYCHECKLYNTIILNYKGGYYVCTKCGIIIHNHVYADDGGIYEDENDRRCGLAGDNDLRTTTLTNRGIHKRTERLDKKNQLFKQHLDNVCQKMCLEGILYKPAIYKLRDQYMNYIEEENEKNETNETSMKMPRTQTLLAACIFYNSKMNNIKLASERMSTILDVKSFPMMKIVREFEIIFGTEQHESKDNIELDMQCINQYFSYFKILSKEVLLYSKKLIHAMRENNYHKGIDKDTYTKCIFIRATLLCNHTHNIPESVLCDKIGISTQRVRYMKDILDEISENL